MENEETSQKINNILGKKSNNYIPPNILASMLIKYGCIESISKVGRVMKTLIVLVLGLLAVGCLTPEQKQKALRDSVVGEYERKPNGDTYKDVYLENGIAEWYVNGKKQVEGKWSIANGEIHVKYDSGEVYVCRINPESDSFSN